MTSLWAATAEPPGFGPLAGDIKTDVLIIGGGIAGVLCAYQLTKAGVDCVLVEADRIGGGVTGNTSAKITSQHGLCYDKLIRSAGAEKARMVLDANQAALRAYRELCVRIGCGFEERDAYVFSRNDRAAIEKEVLAVNKLDYSAQFTEQLPLPIQTVGAMKFPRQAQFHPLQFLYSIAAGLQIYEHTRVTGLARNIAVTPHGRIRTDAIIIATHFPILNKHGSYFLKLYQHRSYAVALENAADVGGMYLEETKDGLSFRNYQNLLILGGGDHRTGKQGGNWQILREFSAQHYPDAHEKYAWAAQDCMSLDGIPYIGRYSARTENLYVATGFNKWGMTSAMAASEILRDMILGRQNDYAPAFSPSRSILKPQLLFNGCAAVGNLLRFSKKRCPHLGCALRWNRAERSWDCPCHGSRFTETGKLLDGPATGDLKNENFNSRDDRPRSSG